MTTSAGRDTERKEEEEEGGAEAKTPYCLPPKRCVQLQEDRSLFTNNCCTRLKDILGSIVARTYGIKTSISTSLRLPSTEWTEGGGNASFNMRIPGTDDPRISFCRKAQLQGTDNRL